VDPKITFLLALAEYEEEDVTPFQGFAPGLLDFTWALHSIISLPADLFDPATSRNVRLARRVSGTGGWRWAPLLISSLEMISIDPATPLYVVFSNEAEIAKRVRRWSRQQKIKPLHVSGHGQDAVHPSKMSVEVIERFCRKTILAAKRLDSSVDDRHWFDIVDKWQPVSSESSKLHFRSHNVTTANEMVLASEGVKPSEGAHLNPLADDDYVVAMVDSAKAVLDLRDEAGFPRAFLANPPRPDIILFAPAMYRHVLRAKFLPDASVPGAAEAARLLIRQTGYAIHTSGPVIADAMSGAGRIIFELRTRELVMQSAAVGMRAASTVAATLRLPPQVNRIAGVIRQLAIHLRSNPAASHKTRRVFGLVQAALRTAVDERLLTLIQGTQTGIKIVADALLEWLPVQGLPLGLRYDVSRINATPGGLTFGELINSIPIYLRPEAFSEVLVLSAFDADDPIKDHLRDTLQKFDRNGALKPTVVEVRTIDEMVAALNSFRGTVLVFDGHGVHDEKDDIGFLKIGDERLDVWQLRKRARVPPIVLLSACDTHALDRSHVTTANGFLSCGARAVLATVLPVRSMHSALVIARLLFRGVEFSRAVHSAGRTITWANLVGGLLRMQMATDIVMDMHSKKLLTEKEARKLTVDVGLWINTDEPDWFEKLASQACDLAHLSSPEWLQLVEEITAKSDVIRYVHLGNPESIIVTSPEIVEAHREPPNPAA